MTNIFLMVINGGGREKRFASPTPQLLSGRETDR